MSDKPTVAHDFVAYDTKEHYIADEVFPKEGVASEERIDQLRDLGYLYPGKEQLEEKKVSEIKKELDDKNIAYDSKANKPELVELLEKAIKDTE